MITIYDEFTEDFYNNGLGILKDCIDPIVKEELNGIFELEFDYPINLKKREYLKTKNIIKCDCGYEQKQLFRIVRVKPDLENIIVYAQHITYDLASNMLEDVYPQNLNGNNALDWMFNRTQYPHKFKAFSDIVKASTARWIRKNPLEAILGDDENSFVNRWGGELLRDNFNTKMLQRRGSNTGYRIKVGKNATGVEITEDDSSLCTRLMPIAYEGILLPEKYVDSQYIKNYSHPYIKIFDCKDIKLKNSESEDAEGFETLEECYAEMRKRCVEKFEVEKIDRSKINIKVDFVDLKNTTEYEKYLHLETIKLGDTVTFIYKDISYELRVIKTEYDPNKKKFTKLELGEFKGNYITNSNKTITNIVKQETESLGNNLLTQAKDSATEQIKSALGGYIYKTQNELFIMDNNDVNKAKKVWRWNLNGLGYSEKGIGGPYKTAITQDGQIVANFITTGTMSADRIEGLSNTLNEFSKIIMDHNKIQLLVNNTIDITQEIEKETDILELLNCMEGSLLELRIDGNNTVFSETKLDENIEFNENTTFTGQSSILSVFTNNVCSQNKEDYEVGAYGYKDGTLSNFKCYIRNKDLFRLKKEYDQLKITVNQEYRLVNLYYWDKDRNYLGDNSNKFYPENKISNKYEAIVDIPEEAYYMGYIFKNKNATSDQSEIEILPDEIGAINPRIHYIKTVDLGITEELRCHKEIIEDTEGKKTINEICDQVIIKPGVCTLIRRVGEANGNTYKLAEEIIQDLKPINMYLLKGLNYIKLHNYSTKMYVKYVKTNEFTDLFMSQVEMNATLEMLYNHISLSVRQNNIMAALQMAIEDGQGVIEFKSDLFSLTSKFLKITREGKITATSGEFGGWILNSLYLYANYVINETTYQCGLYSGVTNGNDVFLYAGAPLKSDGTFESVTKWNTYITKNGLINAKWFKVNRRKRIFLYNF